MRTDFDRLMEILKQVVPNVDIASVREEQRLTADLGLNSLSIMLLAMSVEDSFGFEFGEDADFETVRDVLDYVAKHKTL